MISILAPMIPVLALLIGFLPLIAVRYWLDRKIEKNWKHSPLGTDMLRPPGYSLRKEITQIDDDMLTWICLLVTSPILWTAMFLSLVFVGGYPNRSLALISTVCFGAVAYAVFARKVWALKKKRTNLVLGCEGELATAQHLDLLMLEGCRMFHDMECNCGNIDHIVVSRSGVFSINSKGYSKPQKTKNVARIDYPKRTMFLTGKEVPLSPIQAQVEAEANCLSKLLAESVGEPIGVEPLIALPGWWVEWEGKKPKDVCVFSPKNSGRYFLHRGPDKLSPKLITQISHQLEQKCRTVSAETKIEHELSVE